MNTDTSSSGRDAEGDYNSERHEDPNRNQASEGNGGSNNASKSSMRYLTTLTFLLHLLEIHQQHHSIGANTRLMKKLGFQRNG